MGGFFEPSQRPFGLCCKLKEKCNKLLESDFRMCFFFLYLNFTCIDDILDEKKIWLEKPMFNHWNPVLCFIRNWGTHNSHGIVSPFTAAV